LSISLIMCSRLLGDQLKFSGKMGVPRIFILIGASAGHNAQF
jgi:hypothetical protein